MIFILLVQLLGLRLPSMKGYFIDWVATLAKLAMLNSVDNGSMAVLRLPLGERLPAMRGKFIAWVARRAGSTLGPSSPSLEQGYSARLLSRRCARRWPSGLMRLPSCLGLGPPVGQVLQLLTFPLR